MIVLHGTADGIVHPANAETIVRAARADAGDTVRTQGLHGARPWQCRRTTDADARPRVELWLLEGAGHAWSGGHPSGSFTDPAGPSASAEMLRFFLAEAA